VAEFQKYYRVRPENCGGQVLHRIAGEIPEHDHCPAGGRVEAHQVPIGAATAEVLDQAAAVVGLVPPPPAQARGELVARGGECAHRDGGLGREQPPAAGHSVTQMKRQEPRGVLHVADEAAVGWPVDVERPEGHQVADALAGNPRREQQPQGDLPARR